MENQVVPPEGDKNAGPKLEAVYGLWLFIAFILVNLRLYVRARILKKLWWDDFFLLLGVVRTPIEYCITECLLRVHSCCRLPRLAPLSLE